MQVWLVSAGVVIRAGCFCGWGYAVLHRPAGALPEPADKHQALLHVLVHQHHRAGHVPQVPAATPARASRRRRRLHHL